MEDRNHINYEDDALDRELNALVREIEHEEAPLAEPERRDFWEICEDRYEVRSTILTSQLPVARWHEQIAIPLWPAAFSTGSCTTPTHRDARRLHA